MKCRTLEGSFGVSFYQVIMMIDIFQYSNVYVTRKSLQWLADAHHVREECGPYVTKPGMLPFKIHPSQGVKFMRCDQDVKFPTGPDCYTYTPVSNLAKLFSNGWKSMMC